MTLRRFLIGIVLCTCALPAQADLVFPARLDVIEVSSGELEITMALPLVGGRKPNLEPVLPPQWERLGEPEVSATPNTWSSRIRVRADVSTLAGEAILVAGLPGSQTDVAFTCELLDGRRYTTVFRAARSGFLFPGPPDPVELAMGSIRGGMRRLLGSVPIWALLIGAAFAGTRRRTLFLAAGAAGVGHLAGQWLGRFDLLGGSMATANLFAALMTWVPAAGMAGIRVRVQAWLAPLGAVAVVLGLMFGAAIPETVAAEGLSRGEQLFTVFGFAIGFGLAWALVAWIGSEARDLIRGSRFSPVWIGTFIAAFATGIGLVEFADIFATRSSGALGFSWLAMAGFLIGVASPRWPRWAGFIAVPLIAGAAAMGVGGVQLPAESTLMLGSIAFVAVAIAMGRTLKGATWIALVTMACVAATWFAASNAVEISARPWTVLGAEILAAAAAILVGRVAGAVPPAPWLRGVAIVFAALAVVERLRQYSAWFDLDLATEMALGWIRLPVLTLALIAAAVFLWPRRSSVARELGVRQVTGSRHWFALGLAIFLLPYGGVRVPNPFHEPEAPRGENARRVLGSVLSDTYHAFNIEEEGELYDRLAASVSDDLIDDVYLDSRRRLTSGTREGAKVVVRDVRVVEVGDPAAGAGAQDFAYECTWRVVARVSHLKHVHHRQNLYRGILTLQVDEDRWKISGLELLSEDRSVVPWSGS